jgi:hypothetical protein
MRAQKKSGWRHSGECTNGSQSADKKKKKKKKKKKLYPQITHRPSTGPLPPPPASSDPAVPVFTALHNAQTALSARLGAAGPQRAAAARAAAVVRDRASAVATWAAEAGGRVAERVRRARGLGIAVSDDEDGDAGGALAALLDPAPDLAALAARFKKLELRLGVINFIYF